MEQLHEMFPEEEDDEEEEKAPLPIARPPRSDQARPQASKQASTQVEEGNDDNIRDEEEQEQQAGSQATEQADEQADEEEEQDVDEQDLEEEDEDAELLPVLPATLSVQAGAPSFQVRLNARAPKTGRPSKNKQHTGIMSQKADRAAYNKVMEARRKNRGVSLHEFVQTVRTKSPDLDAMQKALLDLEIRHQSAKRKKPKIVLKEKAKISADVFYLLPKALVAHCVQQFYSEKSCGPDIQAGA